MSARVARLTWIPAAVMVAACGTSSDEDAEDASGADTAADATPAVDTAPPPLTWHGVAEPVLDRHCTTCHHPGGLGPMDLTTPEALDAWAPAVRASIASGSMPPWPPADDCTSYQHDRRMPDGDRDALFAWLDAGQPLGTPADAPPAAPAAPDFRVDLSIPLPEPYTPEGLDDYRCQLVAWPEDAPTYITGVRISPDARDLVHHTILYAADANGAERYRALDAADPGPGWSCFGGPDGYDFTDWWRQLDVEDAPEILRGMIAGEVDSVYDLPFGVIFGADGGRWLAEWTPGAGDPPLPAGTGLRMDPGDVVILQMHYNTFGATPRPDRSTVDFTVADTVARPAAVVPALDLAWITGIDQIGTPMDIPAGDPDVTHASSLDTTQLTFAAARNRLGLDRSDDLVVHMVGHHMHQLGTSASLGIDDGTCLLEIPDWDFDWQGMYALETPVVLEPDDLFELSCSWDNSPANQIVVDGVPLEPRDVDWGDGTTDEMCLGILYVTGP